jgi:hypothetical protein
MRHNHKTVDQILQESKTSNGDWYDDGQYPRPTPEEDLQELIDEATNGITDPTQEVQDQ